MNRIGRMALGAVVCLAVGTAAAVEWPLYNARERENCNKPIRPGEPGGRPFWNKHAIMYKHAPAFDVKDVEGAASYEFTLMHFHGEGNLKWTADHPWRPIPPHVWSRTTCGDHDLEIWALGKDGKRLQRAAYLKCHRSAPFNGPYPEANSTHAWTAERVFGFVANAPYVRQWLKTGEPSKDYNLYCYPSKILGAMMRALVRYPQRDAKGYADAKAIACKMADWLIAHSQPADAPLANFPPTYWGNQRGEAVRYAGQNMLVYPAAAGLGYLDVAEATGEKKYRAAAIAIADTYLKLQGEDGTWPLKIWEKDGTPSVPNRLIPGRCELDFLERIAKLTGEKKYQAAADRAFQYVLDGPCKTWNWQGQFEDMKPLPPYENLQHGVAGETAVRLFARGQKDLGCEITDWCEDQFVVWDIPSQVEQIDTITPTALEQYKYYTPIDASMAGMIRTFVAAWQASGDELYYQKAKALADNLARQQHRNGEIPTYFRFSQSGAKNVTNWINCMIYDALVLDDFAKLEYDRWRTVRHERIKLWPEGKMPDRQENQQYEPYIDWYKPTVLDSKLILIHCSGGGYGGSNDDGFEVNPVRQYFLDRGVTVVTLRYRAPRPQGLAKHQTAWQDAQRAIRIVRREAAARGGDPERIGFLGCSAGGHLTLMAALSSGTPAYARIDETDDLPCHLNFAVPVYPAYALEPEMDKADVVGCDDLTCKLAPEFAFDGKIPPMCFIHGDIDAWSPMASVRVYHRLRTMKVPCEMHILTMEGHCFMEHPMGGFPASNWKDRVWDWLFRLDFLKGRNPVRGPDLTKPSEVAAKIAAKCRVVRTDDFHGYRRTVFEFNGEQAFVVEPRVEKKGRPWTWTMEWPGAYVERTGAPAMLARGYHHVSLTGGSYRPDGTFDAQHGNMNDKRLAASRAFQKFLVEELGFAPQAKLIGMSWGGFFSIRYAASYPGCVSRMYLDCPLCDFTTLPNWKKGWNIQKNYGVDENYVSKDDPRMPINMAAKVAAAGTEIFLLYGGQDQTVPPEANGKLFLERFRAAGGKIQVGAPKTYAAGDFGRGAFGHHPHGLEPTGQQPLVDFFENGIRE